MIARLLSTRATARVSLASLAALASLATPGTSSAALKGEAEFTRVINDVKVLPVEAAPAPAEVGDRITGKTAVSTGVKSRAELRFPDKTLTRLGSNSVFRMDQANKTVELDKGVILLQVPKQLGGAKVRTAAVTAAVTGTTILVEFMPDGFIKIIVVEGECDVFLNERKSVFRTLRPGDLWISKANDTSGLPAPVQIDLERLKKTSKLMDDETFSPLGNSEQVDSALSAQAKKKADGELLATAFRIEGRGRQVTLTQGERNHVLAVNPTPPPPPRIVAPAPTTKIAVAGPGKPVLPSTPVSVPDTTVFEDGTTINTAAPLNAYNSASGELVPLAASHYSPTAGESFNTHMFGDAAPADGGIDGFLATRERWWVFKGEELFISGNPTVDSTGGPRDLILGATGDILFTDAPPFDLEGAVTGNHWTLDGNTDGLALTSNTGSINLSDFRLSGTTQDIAFYAYGAGSDINVTGEVTPAVVSVPAGTVQAKAGRDIQVAGATIEARTVDVTAGQDVNIGSATAGGATVAASESVRVTAQRNIRISNTSQLRRLTQIDNPQVFLESVAGNIDLVESSTIEADLVDMLAHRGNINIINASVAARDIGARVLDPGGTLLISSSTLGNGASPADLIRLYGEGAGGVRFSGLTTLRGNQVDIAGRSVTVDRGSLVRLSNPDGTRVFADSHNYNSRDYGAFTNLDPSQGGGGPSNVSRGDFNSRPSY